MSCGVRRHARPLLLAGLSVLSACPLRAPDVPLSRDGGPVPFDVRPASFDGLGPFDGPVSSCAFPVAVRAPARPTFAGLAPLGTPGCRFAAGAPIPLPVSVSEGTNMGFAFSYDVNGDEIGDLFFLSWDTDPPRLRLFTSSVDAGALSYVAADCPDLGALGAGRTFARDLNGDGVPDFVVGTVDGVSAYLNLPDGLHRVLGFDWGRGGAVSSTLPWEAALEVAVADFDGNGAADLAFGYDRVFGLDGGTSFANVGIERGVKVFLAEGFGGALRYRDAATLVDPSEPSGAVAVRRPLWGGLPLLFTLGACPGVADPHACELVATASTPPEVNVGAFCDFSHGVAEAVPLAVPAPVTPPPSVDPRRGPFDAAALSFGGSDDALALVWDDALVVYDLHLPAKPLFEQPTAFRQYLGHGSGGGWEAIPRAFVDADGDGDLDFVELRPPVDPPVTIAVSANAAGAAFEPPQLVTLARPPQLGVEAPFAAVGTAQAGLVVISPWGAIDAPPDLPAVVPLGCAP